MCISRQLISDLNGFYGHREINVTENEVKTEDFQALSEGVEIDLVLIKNDRFSLIPKNN